MVQTEDFGMEKAQIASLICSGGQILYSRKISYHEMFADNDVQHVVAERVKTQHLAVLADIRNDILASDLMSKKGS
jgi:hypothetical protein